MLLSEVATWPACPELPQCDRKSDNSLGVQPDSTIVSNSLIALLGLTVSGLGVSYLPRSCREPMLKNGLLSVVRTNPPLPSIRYVAMYKRDVQSPLTASIIMLAQECCDFTRMFQTPQQ